jgi:hypothetical protein
MDPTPIDYQMGDLIVWRHGGDRPGDPRRYTRVVYRTNDIKDGQPGFVGETMGGPADGQPVWGYDRQIVWVRHHKDGGESYRWAGDLNDGHLEEFCDWWQLDYRWTRTGLDVHIKDRWKTIAPGAVLTMGKPAT